MIVISKRLIITVGKETISGKQINKNLYGEDQLYSGRKVEVSPEKISR